MATRPDRPNNSTYLSSSLLGYKTTHGYIIPDKNSAERVGMQTFSFCLCSGDDIVLLSSSGNHYPQTLFIEKGQVRPAEQAVPPANRDYGDTPRRSQFRCEGSRPATSARITAAGPTWRLACARLRTPRCALASSKQGSTFGVVRVRLELSYIVTNFDVILRHFCRNFL